MPSSSVSDRISRWTRVDQTLVGDGARAGAGAAASGADSGAWPCLSSCCSACGGSPSALAVEAEDIKCALFSYDAFPNAPAQKKMTSHSLWPTGTLVVVAVASVARFYSAIWGDTLRIELNSKSFLRDCDLGPGWGLGLALLKSRMLSSILLPQYA